MRPIPPNIKKEMLADPYYASCSRKNEECQGRITFEHVWIYSGKQINEVWAIIPLCVYHHLGDGLNKNVNRMISILRATPDDLAKYPRKNWAMERKHLYESFHDLLPESFN